jgi:competence protein ComEC
MKLPAVPIAALFAGGIALGLSPFIAPHATSNAFLVICFVWAGASLLAGFLLVKLNRLFPAAAASCICWMVLGVLGACLAEQPRPRHHVLSQIESGRLALKSPLRWHGQLRDEPTKLPWGYGYEIALSGVEYEGAWIPVTGGLRLSFTTHPQQPLPPEVHAGDELSVLTQAKLPQVFKDDGAFDRREYLAQQGIDLVATLRAPELLERVSSTPPTIGSRLARTRQRLREAIDQLFSATPQAAGVLRAMLLGDRHFVDQAEATDFQKAGVYHVLVVAGLHVGAIAMVLFWAGRRLRLSPLVTILFTLTLLSAYVAVVEQRPPVMRAALMTALVLIGSFFFRRLDLLNSAALAALLLLVAKPLALRDSSFQLTFLAIGCIAGIAAPWLDRALQPYVRALRGWRDVTRDASQEPRAAQFRIDLRSLARWITSPLPARAGTMTGDLLAGSLAFALRACELLVITMVLQIGMLPLMARDFHRVTLAGPAANLLAVPVMSALVPLGFLTLLVGSLVPALGKLLAVPIGWLTLFLVHVAQWFAHFPAWSYRIPGPALGLTLFFFLAAIMLAAAIRMPPPWRNWMSRAWLCVLLAAALLVAIYPFAPQWSKGKLEVSVLDVGQGDSLFIVSPGGKTMLIDGGGAFAGFPGREEHNGIDPGEDAVSPYLWSRGFQKLDVVALTHAHQDHLGGLTAILENFRVAELWIGREVSSVALGKLEELARRKNIPIQHELRGKTFSWDGVDGEFLWPTTPPGEVAPSAKNNDSLVLRLHYLDRAILLPGDAEKQVEHEIVAENRQEDLRADVLKVGHHGSKNSTTPEFLDAVRPAIGIISAGAENPYGHPSPELLERLENANVRILRTDRDGAVHILTDGKKWEISCYARCPESLSGNVSAKAEKPNQQQQNEKQ